MKTSALSTPISSRLKSFVDALPLKPGMRILEIGCGPGVAAREIVNRIDDSYVLAIDRSAKAIQQAIRSSSKEIKSGRLSFRQLAVEDLELEKGEELFDIAFAIRVGALDGRHPALAKLALPKIARVLTKKGRLFIDGGDPLREISLASYR